MSTLNFLRQLVLTSKTTSARNDSITTRFIFNKFSFLFIFFSITFLTFGSVPNDNNEISKKEPYILQRIKGVVKLDALSNETAWEGITPLPLVMLRPDSGKNPSEKTEILIAYDQEFLYIAGRFFDSAPSKILSGKKKRDTGGLDNDWLGVLIDSCNDKENGLAFYTNPNGVRFDFSVSNDAQGNFLNSSWDSYWDVVSKITKDGWFTEMRIPLSSLQFKDANGQVVMGITTWRLISRKNEIDVFPERQPKWGPVAYLKPSLCQEVVLDSIKPHNPIFVTPYLLGGIGQSFSLDSTKTQYHSSNKRVSDIGLDVKYNPTRNLTLYATVNTDFSQVEADDTLVNLTRFSLFFPEKRQFFQERSQIFEFNMGDNNKLFYSRRIGIYGSSEVPIYGGFRLVGRLGGWDLGLLSMQTKKNEDFPSENMSVLRLRRRVFNPYSYVGAMVTSRIGMNGDYNLAYGLDGIFRLSKRDDYLNFNWAQSFENGVKNSLDSGKILVLLERRNIEGFGYALHFSRSGPDYNPGMGFENRQDYTLFDNKIRWGWLGGDESKLINSDIYVNGACYLINSTGSMESAYYGIGHGFNRKSGHNGSIAIYRYEENVLEGFSFLGYDPEKGHDVLAGKYGFLGLDGYYQTPVGRKLQFSSTIYAGQFYDGNSYSVSLTPKLSTSYGLEMGLTYKFDHIAFSKRDRYFNFHVMRLNFLAMFDIHLSLAAFIQYNSGTDKIIGNVRLRYNFREGHDLYLAYNEDRNTDRFRMVPFLPATNTRTIMLKYLYTFQF